MGDFVTCLPHTLLGSSCQYFIRQMGQHSMIFHLLHVWGWRDVLCQLAPFELRSLVQFEDEKIWATQGRSGESIFSGNKTILARSNARKQCREAGYVSFSLMLWLSWLTLKRDFLRCSVIYHFCKPYVPSCWNSHGTATCEWRQLLAELLSCLLHQHFCLLCRLYFCTRILVETCVWWGCFWIGYGNWGCSAANCCWWQGAGAPLLLLTWTNFWFPVSPCFPVGYVTRLIRATK